MEVREDTALGQGHGWDPRYRDLEPSMTHTHSDGGGGDTVLPNTGSDQLKSQAAGPLFVMGCLPGGGACAGAPGGPAS